MDKPPRIQYWEANADGRRAHGHHSHGGFLPFLIYIRFWAPPMIKCFFIHPFRILTDCNDDEWMCDYGQCIPLSNRCNNNIDCPDDVSDERNCACKFSCINSIVFYHMLIELRAFHLYHVVFFCMRLVSILHDLISRFVVFVLGQRVRKPNIISL